jgi:beta-lactamase superfamily II metal-dependent hydrolase
MFGRLISLALLALVACATAGCAQDETAQLVFLDIGQGDAILIRSPEGRAALVDAGPAGIDLVGMLRRLGIDTVDIAVATHPHADHIGEMAAVLRSLPVRYYMDNGQPHTTATYRELLETIQLSDVTYLQALARRIELGSVTLTVLPPLDNVSIINNGSIGLVVEFGEFRALLTGDSQIEELNHFLSLGVPEVAVLKAAHHGNRDAVSPAWLSATRPEIVVISCGLDNSYGVPHDWALRYFEEIASRVFRTDHDGEVTVTAGSDGRYTVTTSKSR